MSSTPRFGLPFLSAGQAQKEVFVNEALQILDIVAAAAVEEPPRATPPDTPQVGDTYIVSASPSGDWTGKAYCLAAFTTGGWRFVAPNDGLFVLEKLSGSYLTYREGGWEVGVIRGASLVIDGSQVVGPRALAIPDPSGGSTVDNEARMTLRKVLAALRGHGLVET
jgi:hypothetical protein